MDIVVYGKNANAIVHATEGQYSLDEYSRAQIQMICDNDCSIDSTIRVMPDVHAGKAGPIGLTMTVHNQILPSLVGVDIGCGMTVVKFKSKGLEFQQIDKIIQEYVPVGFKIRDKEHKYSDRIDLFKLKCEDDVDILRGLKSIGTLGGGNHFIEIDKDEDNNTYLVVHSGSRHLGVEVCDCYLREGQREAQESGNGFPPYEMSYLKGQLMDDYFHDITIIQEFAQINRDAIIDSIMSNLKWKEEERFTSIHNYIDFSGDTPILRKGAISAKDGERVIIPINMRDGVIIGTGLGNDDWNCSAPHGAGRVYRRSEVANHHTVSEFKKEMEGIYSSCIGKDTLDESPFAYRDIESIKSVIQDTVTIDKVLKPVYNYKAGK